MKDIKDAKHKHSQRVVENLNNKFLYENNNSAGSVSEEAPDILGIIEPLDRPVASRVDPNSSDGPIVFYSA